MLRARAPAKVNLTLHVLGRREDGFHELDSLVAFAGCAADALTLTPGEPLSLLVEGPFAGAAGEGGDNLVLKAAREAAARIEGLVLGRFSLVKRIPVAAGLGGGSADAGAALRLIAAANGLRADDPRFAAAAAATGSDVPACLVSRAARMTGRGEGVAPLDGFAPLAAVLANPLKAVSTAEIFRRLGLAPGERFFSSPLEGEGSARGDDGASSGEGAAHTSHPTSAFGSGRLLPPQVGCFRLAQPERPTPQQRSWQGEKGYALVAGRNDLEAPARALLREIGEGIDALAASEGCRLARMSGSGASVFGLYDDARAARRAARTLHNALPGWWIRPTLLR